MEFAKNCTVYELCSGNIEFEYNYFHSSALEFDWIFCGSTYWNASFRQSIGLFWQKTSVTVCTYFCISMIVCSALAPIGNCCWLQDSHRLVHRRDSGGCVHLCNGNVATRTTHGTQGILQLGCSSFAAHWFVLYISGLATSKSGMCGVFFAWSLHNHFVFPESPTWLHNKGRLEQMRINERKIASFVGEKYVEVQHEPIVETESFKQLVRDKALFKRISVLWIMWFIAALCGYAIDLNSSNIVGNLFLNQALFSILIALSKAVLVVFDTMRPSFSRRNLHQYSQLVVIISFLVLTLLVLFNQQGVSILIVNLIGTRQCPLQCEPHLWFLFSDCPNRRYSRPISSLPQLFLGAECIPNSGLPGFNQLASLPTNGWLRPKILGVVAVLTTTNQLLELLINLSKDYYYSLVLAIGDWTGGGIGVGENNAYRLDVHIIANGMHKGIAAPDFLYCPTCLEVT
uniref:Uncharacterized protein n=1 Tax=Ditylenchus dipsaci TaxID=166011 RepID=A0A915D402_9BILA